MVTIVVDGIVYNITDHSESSGVSAEDVERMIRNLHKTDSYKNNMTNLDPSDKTVNIHIDSPDTGTGIDIVDHKINLRSSDFEDGGLPIPDSNGKPMQNTLDLGYSHEIGHFLDAKKNDTPLGSDPKQDEERAIQFENEVRNELGLPLRAEDGHPDINPFKFARFEIFWQFIKRPITDFKPGGGLNQLDDEVYDNVAPFDFDEWMNDPELADIAFWYEEILDLFDKAEDDGSPLVLDLDGDGVELISLHSSDAVYWDIDLDGFAEVSGWVHSDDGFLAIDLNNDGVINNSSELFGDQTGFSNGFLALTAYDTNNDGLITNADANWDDLIVWRDINGNGYSESSELFSLDDLLITEINLGYTDVNYSIAGNAIKQESTFTMNGNTHTIVDAYFAFNNSNTIYNGVDLDYTYDLFELPLVRGYGIVPDLYTGMALDNDEQDPNSLKSLVAALAEKDFSELFDGTLDLQETVRDIMFRWAGVEDVETTSRGPNVDARELEFIEKFIGRSFWQNAGDENPMTWAGHDLQEAFHIAYENVFARLLAQSAGSELFEGDIAYNLAADSIEGITGLNTDRLDDLETAASALSTTAEKKMFWGDVVRMIEFSECKAANDNDQVFGALKRAA